MKLIDALKIVSAPRDRPSPRLEVALVCGFTPLHLETYLAAHLRLARPDHEVAISTGMFDDLIGNLDRAATEDVEAIVVIVEWADIDPRLGVRRIGGWSLSDLADIDEAVELNLARLAGSITAAAQTKSVVLSLPTLPFPPLFPQRPDESGSQELRLRARLMALAATLAECDGIRICSPQRLDQLSSLAARRDPKAELSSGFPYSLDHACTVAAMMSDLVCPPAPKKGLITDLDDTLWSGIVGEVGAETVSWNLDAHSQRHALFQQLLGSLASAGVLIGIASKNEPGPVKEALSRSDLLLSPESIFPIEVHWGRKSDSVRRILGAWNIAPDAVVIVDDSPLELAEVQSAFPQITPMLFPGDDKQALDVLTELRSLFGKSRSTAEDGLRVASLRAGIEFRASADDTAHTADEFLIGVGGCVEVTVGEAHRFRALELFNKTNQFNLNGIRLTEAGLERTLRDPSGALVTVAYKDRYGPLGTIAAIVARQDGSTLSVDSWVMSCRAFSRRIEHHCLQHLFDRFEVDRIEVAYRPTERNRPVREFLSSLIAAAPAGSVALSRDEFHERVPLLMHKVADAQLDVCVRS